MGPFIQNSTAFLQHNSACVGRGPRRGLLASFYKIECGLFRGRGALEAGWERADGKKEEERVAWKPKGT